MSWATLAGIPCAKAELTVPFSGIWHADVSIDRDLGVPPPGPVPLQIGTSIWTCTAIRSVDFAGIRRLRMVGGTGGWGSTVSYEYYSSPSGVPTSVVLADVAALAKEIPPVVDPTLSPTVGTAFARQEGLASLVLQQVCGAQWWMDPTGTVQTSIRLPTAIVSFFTVQSVDGAMGRYIVQTESPQDWAPGASFLSPLVQGTIARTVWMIDEAGIRLEVLTSDVSVAA